MAATTRTSTVSVWSPPTRSNCRSWTRRRIFPWRGSGRSPISSRKSVPLWASSALPTLRPPAPVKAPFSWPNSSFSRRFSGIAAQLMATKGPLARAESWCSARLISSLPVPLSPRSRTVVSVAAARCRDSMDSFSAGSSPSTRGSPKRRWCSSFRQHQLGPLAPPLHRAVQEQEEVVGVDGLGQEVGGAVLHGPDRLLHRSEGGHDDDRHLGVSLPRRFQDVEAAAGGQLQVGQDHQVPLTLETTPGLVGVPGLVHPVATGLQGLPQHRAERLLVLDDQDVGQVPGQALSSLRARRGPGSWNRRPGPIALPPPPRSGPRRAGAGSRRAGAGRPAPRRPGSRPRVPPSPHRCRSCSWGSGAPRAPGPWPRDAAHGRGRAAGLPPGRRRSSGSRRRRVADRRPRERSASESSAAASASSPSSRSGRSASVYDRTGALSGFAFDCSRCCRALAATSPRPWVQTDRREDERGHHHREDDTPRGHWVAPPFSSRAARSARSPASGAFGASCA